MTDEILSLDSLIGEKTSVQIKRKKRTVATAPVRAKFPDAPKAVRKPTPEARVLIWSSHNCSCGATYDAPTFAGTTLFVRVRLSQWKTELRPIMSGIEYCEGVELNSLPLITETRVDHVAHCPKCIKEKDSQLELDLSPTNSSRQAHFHHPHLKEADSYVH